MASLDFVIDLTEKLKKQNIDFAIITVQKGKQGYIPSLLYQISDLESALKIIEGSIQLNEDLSLHLNDIDPPEDPPKKKKRKGKNGK